MHIMFMDKKNNCHSLVAAVELAPANCHRCDGSKSKRGKEREKTLEFMMFVELLAMATYGQAVYCKNELR